MNREDAKDTKKEERRMRHFPSRSSRLRGSLKKKLKKSRETQIAESLHDRTPTENQLQIFLGAKGELDSNELKPPAKSSP